jgi:hypothetical protein
MIMNFVSYSLCRLWEGFAMVLAAKVLSFGCLKPKVHEIQNVIFTL